MECHKGLVHVAPLKISYWKKMLVQAAMSYRRVDIATNIINPTPAEN